MLTSVTHFSVSRRGIRYSRRVHQVAPQVSGDRTCLQRPVPRLFDVAIVEPLGVFEPAIPDEDDPEDYRFTSRVYRGLTHSAASDKAGGFNDQVLSSEGARPRQWAMIFAPGALDELRATG